MPRVLKLSDFSRIAVVQTAYLGDVALVLPLLEVLRRLHPAAQRALVVIPATAPLAACAEAVDTVIVYDKHCADAGVQGLRRCARRLRRWGAELLLVPHRSLRTALLTMLTAPRCSVGSARSALPWVYRVRVPYGWHLHEVERNLAFLSPFADGADWHAFSSVSVTMRPLPEAESWVEERLAQLGIRAGKGFVVLAPGSAWATKRWKPAHYAELSRLLAAEGYSVVLVGSPAEADLCRAIAEQGSAVSLAGELNIPRLLVLLRHARGVVCNDSAPVHLAELVGTPVVTLFGPTLPQFGFAPRLERSVVLERVLPCRPCSLHGGRRCPLRHHRCLEAISPGEVFERLQPLLR